MVCALFYLEKDNGFFSAWICFSKENKITFQAGQFFLAEGYLENAALRRPHPTPPMNASHVSSRGTFQTPHTFPTTFMLGTADKLPVQLTGQHHEMSNGRSWDPTEGISPPALCCGPSPSGQRRGRDKGFAYRGGCSGAQPCSSAPDFDETGGPPRLRSGLGWVSKLPACLALAYSLASLGHTERRVVLGHTLDTQTLAKTKISMFQVSLQFCVWPRVGQPLQGSRHRGVTRLLSQPLGLELGDTRDNRGQGRTEW